MAKCWHPEKTCRERIEYWEGSKVGSCRRTFRKNRGFCPYDCQEAIRQGSKLWEAKDIAVGKMKDRRKKKKCA